MFWEKFLYFKTYSVDPDQTHHSAASDLGLQSLPRPLLGYAYHMSSRMTKPAKTQISLGIHPVSSAFAVRSMGRQGPKISSCGQ